MNTDYIIKLADTAARGKLDSIKECNEMDVIEFSLFESMKFIYKSFYEHEESKEQCAIEKNMAMAKYNDMVKELGFDRTIYKKVIEDIHKTDNKRVELRKCKSVDRLKVALELINLYSGENFMDLVGE